MTFDINSLPDVQFADLDTATVQSAIITYYEGLTLSVLYPGDPVRLFLSTLAAVIAQRNVLLDFTGKMNLLRYATGAYLDQIAAMYDVQRLQRRRAAARGPADSAGHARHGGRADLFCNQSARHAACGPAVCRYSD
jgi:hypothetical protein